ncbi:MAG: hypothetical protein ACRDTA_19730 [Pseudonocardiaceae bacterium]
MAEQQRAGAWSRDAVGSRNVLMAVLDGIRRTGIHTQVSRCDRTEKRMYVKVCSPEIFAHVPRLLEDYRNPFTGCVARTIRWSSPGS